MNLLSSTSPRVFGESVLWQVVLVMGLLGVLTVPAAADDLKLPEWRYQGTLSQRAPGGEMVPVRTFSVTALRVAAMGRTELVFRLDDEGRGGLHWTQRFGRKVIAANDTSSGPVPSLQHLFDGRTYTIKLPPLSLGSPVTLEDEAEWEVGGQSFEVTQARRVGSQDCWEVKVAGRAGHGETLVVDQQSQQLISATQRVVMGQGDIFEIKLSVAEMGAVKSPQETVSLVKSLLALQSTLNLDESRTNGQLTAKQLTVVQEHLPSLLTLAKGTGWERFAGTIESDITGRAKREESIATLKEKFVGKVAPKFNLTNLRGEPIDLAPHAGKVILLHFWSYRNDPLEEPYGQVGYIEFLRGKREKEGVVVYGVAVDPRFATAEAAAAKRSVRKLQETMRTGYEIAVDGGDVLKTFGNPVEFGVELPLWVVIGRDGKVIEYRTGYYEVDPRDGLRELDAVISTAFITPAP